MNRLCLLDRCMTKQEVSRACGTYNSITSFGFIIGPTLGGIISTYENGFFKVSILSASLFLLNFILVYFYVPTSTTKLETDKKFNILEAVNLFKDIHLVPWALVWDIFLVRFLQSFAMILYRSNFASVLIYRFAIDARTTGYIQSFNGIISAATGFLLGGITDRFSSNTRCHNVFSFVFIISLLGVSMGPSLPFVVLTFIPLCFSSAVLRVTGATTLYYKAGSHSRGLVDGLGNTLTSFARALGPAIGGYAQEVSIFGPGLCGVFLAVSGTLVSVYSELKERKLHKE